MEHVAMPCTYDVAEDIKLTIFGFCFADMFMVERAVQRTRAGIVAFLATNAVSHSGPLVTYRCMLVSTQE